VSYEFATASAATARGVGINTPRHQSDSSLSGGFVHSIADAHILPSQSIRNVDTTSYTEQNAKVRRPACRVQCALGDGRRNIRATERRCKRRPGGHPFRHIRHIARPPDQSDSNTLWNIAGGTPAIFSSHVS
jgi:hypothetical protein